MDLHKALTAIGMLLPAAAFYGWYRFAKWRGASFSWDKTPDAPTKPSSGGGAKGKTV